MVRAILGDITFYYAGSNDDYAYVNSISGIIDFKDVESAEESCENLISNGGHLSYVILGHYVGEVKYHGDFQTALYLFIN